MSEPSLSSANSYARILPTDALAGGVKRLNVWLRRWYSESRGRPGKEDEM